ncbi:arginine--tRNA ligase [Schlesneria sp. DSM 10557]|uniref:arginine--tRNA ligase n=1 Tax=Schlesneria sp. DSM 10557 TaxID=3044399 RepID=UPI0035A0F3CC
MDFLSELRSRLRASLASLTDSPESYVEMLKPSQDVKFGDFQANCAMPLAKQLKRPPRDVAAALVEKLDVLDLCEPPEIAGPGFINFRLKTERLAEETARLASDDRLGVAATTSPRTIIVDYSSPNVAKPMHVGHLRSTVIGNALCRVLRFLGHRVLSDNHVGDWGTQFGMIIYGYKNFRDDAAYQRDAVPELARLYRLVNQLSDYHEMVANLPKLVADVPVKEAAVTTTRQAAAANPADKDAARYAKRAEQELNDLKAEIASTEKKISAVAKDERLKSLAEAHQKIGELARRETAKLHAGDLENKQLWDEFVPKCMAALEVMYQRFGITFDMALGESWYNPMLAGIVEELKRANLAVVSEGATCVFVDGNEAPFIVQKADGAFTYATSDLATIRYRVDTLAADACLYVVDSRQSEHFQLLFATAKKMGYDKTEFRHVSFGTVLGEDRRPYKTRSGDTIGLESLLDEAIQNARKIVDENSSHLSEAERANVAVLVGMGAIIYVDLHHNRDSDYVFSWEKMLATTGDTATYNQYAYARVCGILRKGEVDVSALRQGGHPVILGTAAERALALQLNRFANAVADVAVDYRPNLLTQYLYDTANCFASFYNECPVLSAEPAELRTSRLLLCDATARVLKQGLDLLGIGVADQM